jgi:hypothetical protein
MKIEVGKKYKTRNGYIVFIHSVSRQGEKSIVGEISCNNTLSLRLWKSDGSFESSKEWDLVSEVKEKLKVTFHMDMPEDFKGLTADEIETELRNVFMGSEKKIRICREPNLGWCKGFVCDDIIVSGMTEE